MFLYPVRVRSVPPGRFPKRNALFVSKYRKQIEDYINERAKNYSTIPLSYEQIARDADVPKEVVEVLLRRMGGGYIGITIHNPQLENSREPYRKPS